MSDQEYLILYRFRYFFGCMIIVVAVLLLSVILSLAGSGQAGASGASPQFIGGDDEANIVTSAFDTALNSLDKTSTAALAAGQNANKALRNFSVSALNIGEAGGKTAVRATYSGAVYTAHGVGKGVYFMAMTPVYALHGVANLTHINSIISPSESQKQAAPQIDPVIAAEIASSKPFISVPAAAVQTDSSPQWPIRGAITEEFGVPHWPYQPVHTGIDISDGAAAGVTPIHPFKPGKVIVVIHSNAGFGNHVIVDHGNGMVSLYGHMYATAVNIGQEVNKDTVLGYEGTTGLSTGVHVHFEIDINGQPANPHLYVNGQP